MNLIEEIYKVTGYFPKEEVYGLTNQLRRAAVSIVLNIAEGCGAETDKEFKRFLNIALRSCYEVICGLEVGIRINYGKKTELLAVTEKCDEISAMLSGLKKRISS